MKKSKSDLKIQQNETREREKKKLHIHCDEYITPSFMSMDVIENNVFHLLLNL